MKQNEQSVSTEAQRQALEAMSQELICKLNIMIQEQEARARAFAAAHHTQILPPTPQESPDSQQAVPTPPAPVLTPRELQPAKAPERRPRHRTTTSPPAQQSEESNIGMGIVIFSLIGIFMVIRSCT